MLAMRPITEPDVIELLNKGRFPDAVEGYVVMEGANYLGHILFSVCGDTVLVLDAEIEDNAVLDGAVRACLAAGENRGAACFELNHEDAALARWQDVFCKGQTQPFRIEAMWGECAHDTP